MRRPSLLLLALFIVFSPAVAIWADDKAPADKPTGPNRACVGKSVNKPVARSPLRQRHCIDSM